jgi:hypothetical protein
VGVAIRGKKAAQVVSIKLVLKVDKCLYNEDYLNEVLDL